MKPLSVSEKLNIKLSKATMNYRLNVRTLNETKFIIQSMLNTLEIVKAISPEEEQLAMNELDHLKENGDVRIKFAGNTELTLEMAERKVGEM